MKILKLITVTFTLLLTCNVAQAQFGKRLGKAIEDAAKNATVRKAEQKTEQAVDKAIDKATDSNTYKDKDGNKNDNAATGQKASSGNAGDDDDAPAPAQTPQQGVKAAEMAYAKSDFVAGDEIIFEDNQAGEKLGEFPSMWDLDSGNAEIVTIDGRTCISFERSSTRIVPLMKDMNSYLPDVFTVEMDFYVTDINSSKGWDKTTAQALWLTFYDDKRNNVGSVAFGWDGEGINWNYTAPDNSSKSGNANAKAQFIANSWNHFSLSFNKRALKVYINGVRMANVPNMVVPKRLEMANYSSERAKTHRELISNFRIAKGAVPLYDRMMTDGKIITYGITFDVGKSTIKPESMGEINRIAQLMKDNPDLKFSVEGHTDSTGKADTNQKLSDERSAAVVTKLVEMGIAKDRLTSAGKGQTSPIADNSTDEGRAKNRRVEFVKI